MRDRETSQGDDREGLQSGTPGERWYDLEASDLENRSEGDGTDRTGNEPVRIPVRDQDAVTLDAPPGGGEFDPAVITGVPEFPSVPLASPEVSVPERRQPLHEAIQGFKMQQERVRAASEAYEAALQLVAQTQREVVEAQEALATQELDLEIAFSHEIQDRGLGYLSPHDVDGVITMDNVPALRSDGTIEDGWKAELREGVVVCSKEIDGVPYVKPYAPEEWLEIPGRIGEMFRGTLDQLVQAHPEIWQQAGSDIYSSSLVYARDKATGEYRTAEANIFVHQGRATVVYRNDRSPDRTIVQHISVATFMRWQHEGDAARLAQGELGS